MRNPTTALPPAFPSICGKSFAANAMLYSIHTTKITGAVIAYKTLIGCFMAVAFR
jgi:hypothetical protein